MKKPDKRKHTTSARFELKRDEETGRRYWWGSEDGWKDATEIGHKGVLTLDGARFQVGTVLQMTEPQESPNGCKLSDGAGRGQTPDAGKTLPPSDVRSSAGLDDGCLAVDVTHSLHEYERLKAAGVKVRPVSRVGTRRTETSPPTPGPQR